MPAIKYRNPINAVSRVRFGGTPASAAYTQFALGTGYQTMSGCAKVWKTIYLRPQDFDVGISPGASPSGCSTGSLTAGSVTFSLGASAFVGGGAASAIRLPVLWMGVGASPASPLWATAHIPKPTDADTAGSIIAYVDWTYGSDPATTGSLTNIRVALGYFDSLDAGTVGLRSSACVGGATASYVGTTGCRVMTTCLGTLPAFSACDSGAVIVVRIGASAAGDTGKLSTNEVGVVAVRLDYVANSLGRQFTG